METKYKLTAETKVWFGHILHRIEAVRDFADVKAGDKGGWVENEKNLSRFGYCWVGDDAMVFDKAEVSGDAMVLDNAIVKGHASIFGDAIVRGHASIFDFAMVSGNAVILDDVEAGGNTWILDNAMIGGKAWIFGGAIVSGDTKVVGDTWIFGDADVNKDADIFWISNIGSMLKATTVFRCADHSVKISCGCFRGTLEEFEKAVEEKHGDNKYGREYKAVIELIKIHFGLTGENE